MNNTTSYLSFNQIQRYLAQISMEEFGHNFIVDGVGDVKLLDIGCGPGDILYELVAPRLPENKRKIIGIDISTKMIESARKKYQSNFMEFEQLDFTCNFEECRKTLKQRFDNITSFCCFNWIQDHK